MKTVTAKEMRELDRRTMEEYGIPGLILMEHAGKAVAEAVQLLARSYEGTVAVVCGSGNNGGDGLVAARHLYNKGYAVDVFLVKNPEDFKGDALANFEIIKKLPIPVEKFESVPDDACLIIDALLGTGVHGEVTGAYRTALETMTAAGKPVLSVDIPSGLDADTGNVLGIAVKAAATVTMVLPKKGLMEPAAKDYVGNLIIADIGIPRKLLQE